MPYPWEDHGGLLPWEEQTSVYGSAVDVHRTRTNSLNGGVPNVGDLGYVAPVQSTSSGATYGEDVIASAVPCSIQALSSGRTNVGQVLPADAPGPTHWRIMIPLSALSNGALRDRDILVDDEGYRYQVSAAYWTPLGYQAETIRLEA